MSINRRDQAENRFSFGIVEGGDLNDPDPQNGGRVRVRKVSQHGPNVKTEHLPMTQQVVHPSGQHETPRPPRPGQLVQMLQTLDGHGYVTGIAMGIAKAGQQAFDNMVPQIKEAINKETGMRLPPDIQTKLEEARSGFQKAVKELVEKTDKDKHAAYDGLPSHGALASMAGLINNPVQQVSTALTQFEQQLTSDVLSQLPGQLFSAGKLLSMLTGEQFDEATKDMPTEIKTALTNLFKIKQSDSGGSMPGNFMLGGMVNPETFIPQMIEKLKGVTNLNQLDDVIHKISKDSLEDAAKEGLAGIEMEIEGLFGKFKMVLNIDGTLESLLDDVVSQFQSAFAQIASAIPSAEDVLFGENSKVQELMQRLKDFDAISAIKDNLENKHPDKDTKRAKVTNGGDNGTTVGSNGWLGPI